MFLTKESDYGLRIIRALACGKTKSVQTVSKEQHISQKYAYKIVNRLQAAAYITAKRGCQGGIHLAKPLESISMMDIINAIEPGRYVFECLSDSSKCPFKSQESPCTFHKEMARIQKLTQEALGETSIKALIDSDYS